jgi:hypothetical protein
VSEGDKTPGVGAVAAGPSSVPTDLPAARHDPSRWAARISAKVDPITPSHRLSPSEGGADPGRVRGVPQREFAGAGGMAPPHQAGGVVHGGGEEQRPTPCRECHIVVFPSGQTTALGVCSER